VNVLSENGTPGEDDADKVAGEGDQEIDELDTDLPVPARGSGADGRPLPSTEGATQRRPGFFDLAPEDVEVYRTPGPVVARRKPIDLKPALGVVSFLLILAAIITGVVLLWPSSKARVPNLVGTYLSKAMDIAREKGFTPTVTAWDYSEKVSDGVVISQRPPGRKEVKKGGNIALRISKGPHPETGAVSQSPPAASSAPAGQENASAGPLSSKTITIDPGHQALTAAQEWSDPGMTKRVPPDEGGRGVATGNAEYLVTLDIALKLKSLLEKDGINVVTTRETSTIDLPDITRADIANNADSDLYVRIHCGNSKNPSRTGILTVYPANNKWTGQIYEKSKQAALFIQPELVKSCGLDDLGVVHGEDMPGLNWSKVPVVESQAGFLTNSGDDTLLAEDQFRWKVAWGLRNGIIKYLNNP
jgi:N-acetylmuramoyl-L-alanine amidase